MQLDLTARGSEFQVCGAVVKNAMLNKFSRFLSSDSAVNLFFLKSSLKITYKRK